VFRIDRENDELRTRLSVAGSISAECVDLLESYCEQALKDGKTVDFVLTDVTTIDDAGHALLYRLTKRGVRLSARGLYHAYLIESIRQRADASNGNLQKR
jgi:hypothetical protein